MIKLSIVIALLKTSCVFGTKKKPNVLVILADDVGTGDVPGYYDDTCKVSSMENIEKLISKGILFKNAHATPLCATSRYSFLSGNYQFRTHNPHVIWSIGDKSTFAGSNEKSIADVFNDAGYNTAMMGKWHLGGIIPGMTSKDKILTHEAHNFSMPFAGGPQDIGFKSSLITTSGIQDPPYAFFRDGILVTKKHKVKYWEEGEYETPIGTSVINNPGEGDIDWDSSAYNMILVNETKRFLDDHLEKTPDKPFFAYFATGNVHIPHSPPKKYMDGIPVENSQFTPHMDMLFELDLVVGSLMEALEYRKLIEDTIIIFISDNGGLGPRFNQQKFGHYSNGELRGAKGSLYEGGHRIPMIIRYDKGLPSGETRDNLVGITDLYATLCEMVGISVPDNQGRDSISFANYAKDESNTAGRRWTYGVWNGGVGCAIRSQRFKLVYNKNMKMKDRIELYDLKNDPSEKNNMKGDPDLASVEEKLKRYLKNFHSCF